MGLQSCRRQPGKFADERAVALLSHVLEVNVICCDSCVSAGDWVPGTEESLHTQSPRSLYSPDFLALPLYHSSTSPTNHIKLI